MVIGNISIQDELQSSIHQDEENTNDTTEPELAKTLYNVQVNVQKAQYTEEAQGM